MDRLELANLMLPPEIKKLDPWQREVVTAKDKEILLNVHRQGGKSLIVAIVACVVALTEPGSLILIISRSYRQSLELARKVRQCLYVYQCNLQRQNPKFDVNLGLLTDTKSEFELPNGSRVVSLPPNEETIRGYSRPRLVIFDEHSRIPDDVYLCVRPMFAVSPKWQLFLISTPFGQRGAYYHESQNRDFHKWTWNIEDSLRLGRVPSDFIDKERRKGDVYFRQEMMCEFLGGIQTLFNMKELLAAVRGKFKPLKELYDCITSDST